MTRVFTFIETDESVELDVHFEWYGGKVVNVFTGDRETDVFTFMNQPTEEMVVEACEEYFND